MAQIYNDALDDVPADAIAEGFTGIDTSTKPSRLPAGQQRAGANLWADVDGNLKTRPAARFVTQLPAAPIAESGITYYGVFSGNLAAWNLTLGSASAGDAWTYNGALMVADGLGGATNMNSILTPTAGTYKAQGLGYYDTPTAERLLAVSKGKLYEMTSVGNAISNTHLSGPTFSTSARVDFVQLVDRMFSCDGTLRWHLYSAGWTHGSVTAFSDATAMPTWKMICAHGFRLLAVEEGGHKIYASAIGQANTAADWVKTDTLRVGSGEGDAIQRLISGQGGNLIVVCERSAWFVNTSNASVSSWTTTRITDLTGCIEGRTAVQFAQDVLFLSNYGVVSLGALQTTDSINASTTLSAPIQSLINRINKNAINTAWATAWRDLYVLAVALDADTAPNHLLCYHTKTNAWATPWDIPLKDLTETVTGLTATMPFTGLTCGAISRFAVKQETVIGDGCGRILRLDDSAENDENSGSDAQDITSWATLKAFDFDAPIHLKQLFWTEIEFFRSTSTDCQINIVRDGFKSYPDKALGDCEIVIDDLTTGNLTTFPIVFPLVFQPNETYRKSYNLRTFGRCREVSIQVVSLAGRLQLRQAHVAAFIDTPLLNQ